MCGKPQNYPSLTILIVCCYKYDSTKIKQKIKTHTKSWQDRLIKIFTMLSIKVNESEIKYEVLSTKIIETELRHEGGSHEERKKEPNKQGIREC